MWMLAQVSALDIGIILVVIGLLATTITWAVGFRAKREDDYKADLEKRAASLAERLDECEKSLQWLERERWRLMREMFRERDRP